MLPAIGPLELGIILVIVLVIFGAGRVGELGGALGKGIREFKTSVREEEATEANKSKDKPEDLSAHPATTTSVSETVKRDS
ncbi:MAG TPA: twin-arginine translocase TatA/TatE family subunit [Chloroflexota bacterium]|nr:twin-arginine translocase TatA/TatE family subunit [Chloroflexota bacterium]